MDNTKVLSAQEASKSFFSINDKSSFYKGTLHLASTARSQMIKDATGHFGEGSISFTYLD